MTDVVDGVSNEEGDNDSFVTEGNQKNHTGDHGVAGVQAKMRSNEDRDDRSGDNVQRPHSSDADVPSSVVRGLPDVARNKVQKERKLLEFEYPLLARCGTRIGSIIGNLGGEDKCGVKNDVIDVDAIVLPGKKWSGFGINNRLGVWKMMTVEENVKIITAYKCNADGTNGVSVYFTDLKDLVRQSSVRGNKERVSNMMKKSLSAFGMDEARIEVDFNQPLEAIAQCPQQKSDTTRIEIRTHNIKISVLVGDDVRS
ncbi:hypothetical protein LOK49_LG14G01845 [Camellia lanceoleosa]|uniref:Uncharacterized protein n=1 Tax=Camellia lanceoleosa TaxID=1840588 RepID=A0ACC0FB38_9ERIC|nr:hypothetical protein LOK49_LG14G01845 [Camellia lanceoleosa]